MATLLARNKRAELFASTESVHITATATLTEDQRRVGADQAITITLEDASKMEGLDVFVWRDGTTGSVTLSPPTGNEAFDTAQVITGIADGFSHIKAVGGQWIVLSSKLS